MRNPDTQLEDYLALPYHLVLVPDEDEDGTGGWVAAVEELSGCISQGQSPDEAVTNVRDAMLGWLSVALEDGIEIPLPRTEPAYSGKFVVRIPHSLHGEIARSADEEGVSLNQFVTATLAGAVGWRVPSREPVESGR